MSRFQPGYLSLFKSGELNRRADLLSKRLVSCDICPRKCGVNRQLGRIAFCNSGILPAVASCCVHRGEEPPISGTRGSGTIFFANCTMRCVYCQNYQISQNAASQKQNEISVEHLSARMLDLQAKGCHNINLVTPTHFIPQILQSLVIAASRGLSIPLVYNTSGYESVELIEKLDGIVDIYLPDLRYGDDKAAETYSSSPGYVFNSRSAIKEMHRQVGNLRTNEEGVAEKGLIVRHLILPGRLAGSKESLTWLAKELSPTVTVSIMAQYFPSHQSKDYGPLQRKITPAEYQEVVNLVNELGMENGWLQEMDSSETYVPDFQRSEHPFEG